MRVGRREGKNMVVAQCVVLEVSHGVGVSMKSLGRNVDACYVGYGDKMGNTKGGVDRLWVFNFRQTPSA